MRRQLAIVLFLAFHFLVFFLFSLTTFINILFLEGTVYVFMGTFLASGILGSKAIGTLKRTPRETNDASPGRREEARKSQMRTGVPLIVSGFVFVAASILISVILE